MRSVISEALRLRPLDRRDADERVQATARAAPR
jgi:hypothetical protein